MRLKAVAQREMAQRIENEVEATFRGEKSDKIAANEAARKKLMTIQDVLTDEQAAAVSAWPDSPHIASAIEYGDFLFALELLNEALARTFTGLALPARYFGFDPFGVLL